MNQTELFAERFAAHCETTSGLSLSNCIGTPYCMPESIALPLLQLLSCGHIYAHAPYSYTAYDLNCFLLLYTIKGHGSLRIGKHLFQLNDSSSNLLLLDCHHSFQLSAVSAVWEYQVFFFCGDLLPGYFQMFSDPSCFVSHAPLCDACTRQIESLLFQSRFSSISAALKISSALYQILTTCICTQYPDELPEQLPSYLIQIKAQFDQHYDSFYTLDTLAEQAQISKYRLCREFHSAFGLSPIQYLNRNRIDAAKKLLTDTNCKVYEAGCLVGIDNTNHFISLFKKYTGSTPEQYRKKNQTAKKDRE